MPKNPVTKHFKCHSVTGHKVPILRRPNISKMVGSGGSKGLAIGSKQFEQKQEENTDLLPGLPNDVTVRVICTKLPWRTLYVLSTVSTAWLEAIRCGKIYQTRVRSRTAETLALVRCRSGVRQCDILALYSLRDKVVYPLPTPSDFFLENIPYVAIDGKVYVVGGTAVWVLDVARQQKWRECAKMLASRRDPKCSVYEGKIYVFGGHDYLRQPIDFSEVYDPKLDTWTKLSQMKTARVEYESCVVGDEILVHSGYAYDANYPRCDYGKYWRPTEGPRDGIEAYNPAKDSWRSIPSGDFGYHEFNGPDAFKLEVLFAALGKLLFLSERKIESIDLDKKSAQVLHTVEIRSGSSDPRMSFCIDAVLATNDGIVIKCFYPFPFPANNQCRLFQSTEPVMGKNTIMLEEVRCSLQYSLVYYSLLEPILL